MKKNLLLTILLIVINLIFTNKIYCQTKKYIGGTIEYSVNGKVRPLGKNVTVKYDSFFKSYIITYTDIDGNRYKLTFQYESDSRYNCNGVIYDCIFCESSLSYSIKGAGFLMLADQRQAYYGGTGQSYTIRKLSVSK
jgi:hypothetical protein